MKNFKRVWDGLKKLNTKKDLEPILDKKVGNEHVYNCLLGAECCTLTGRIRPKIGRTKFLNTPISGLAADGAKLSLFSLTQIGYKIVGFIHDEIIIELPTHCNAKEEISLVEQIMISSMKEATGDLVFISCSSEILTDSWKSTF